MSITKFIKNFTNFTGAHKTYAKQAKERLQIVVSHQRADDSNPEFISKMRQELIAVISKYVQVDASNINVNLQQDGNNSVLEMNITIPDELKSLVIN